MSRLLRHQVQSAQHREQIRQYLLAYIQGHRVENVLQRQKALILAQEAEFYKLRTQATAGPPMSMAPQGYVSPISTSKETIGKLTPLDADAEHGAAVRHDARMMPG